LNFQLSALSSKAKLWIPEANKSKLNILILSDNFFNLTPDALSLAPSLYNYIAWSDPDSTNPDIRHRPIYLDILVVIFYTVVQLDNIYYLDNNGQCIKNNSSAEKTAKQPVTGCRAEDPIRENAF
jgi:hypothetical protein